MTALWIQTRHGGAWSLLNPAPDDVDWSAIAESLAKLNRFGGHTEPFYSVAEHCCRVADTLPMDMRYPGLLHDAHTFVIGAINAPVKRALRDIATRAVVTAETRAGKPRMLTVDPVRTLADITDRALFAAAGLPWPLPPAVAARIKHADNRMLVTERRDLMADPARPWDGPDVAPLATPIKPWPWPRAADEWRARFRRWAPLDIAETMEAA